MARDLLDDVHEQIEIERIAPVAEVAARARLRPLARFHSAAQHEELVQSVLKQQGMALDLRHLQAAAAKGITSLREARPLVLGEGGEPSRNRLGTVSEPSRNRLGTGPA